MTQQCMMQQVQVVIQILTCSRRQQRPATTSQNLGTKRVTDERVALKCNDIGDVSTDDVSEHSRHLSGSSDSDAESTPPVETIPPTALARFAPPPGLEVDEPEQHAEQEHRCSRTCNLVVRHVGSNEKATSNWNPNASPFVPESSKNLLALKEALDRLAPNEVATVKSILDSKICDNGMAKSSLQHSRWDGLGAPIARRPFQPFGGRTQPQQGGRTQPQHLIKKETNIPIDSSGDSLRTYLRDLSLVDNGRVLSLRKISKLGLNSGELLETYLSKFGKVERIMVSHTLTKNNQQSNKTRLRPAALGFALMSTVEEARAALDCRESHVVAGVEISVLSFQSHSVDDRTD